MDGKLDFAIVVGTSKDPKLIQIALTTAPFYILMSSQDVLAKRYEVTLDELGTLRAPRQPNNLRADYGRGR